MKRAIKEMGQFSGWLIGSVVATLVAAMADLWLPMFFSNMINVGIETGKTDYILQSGVFMLITTVTSALAAIIAAYCSSRASTGFSRNMRLNFFGKIQTFTQAEMSDFGTSTLITRNTNDIEQVQMFLIMFTRIMVRSPILMVGGAVMAYTKNAGLAMPLLISLPIIAIIIGVIAKIIMPLFLAMQKKLDKVNLVLREQITGIRVVRAFTNEPFEESRFEEVNRDVAQTSYKMMRTISLLMPVLMLIMNLTTVAILWISAGQVNASVGGILIGDVLAIIQYTMQIMFSLVLMSMVFVMFPRAQASARRIDEVMSREPAIQDKEQAVSLKDNRKASVEFKDVSFTFPGAENPSLQNISFKAEKGQTTAIIGGTGSGKSTILSLIIRFFDISKGSVLVNGEDVRELKQEELRGIVGYVPQKAVLFSGTIANNLLYGNRNATFEELSEAARIAQAVDFIEKEEGQFEAHVAQGGTNFSGGQKQRLSIARAIVRNPQIYLFDDSFSALDAATDLKLRQALSGKTKEATIIIVAQRISSIIQADQIIVLDEGKMVGLGTHEELIKNNEVYRQIAASQFSEEEVAL